MVNNVNSAKFINDSVEVGMKIIDSFILYPVLNNGKNSKY